MTGSFQSRFQSSAGPLLDLFSVVLLIDQDFRILFASDTLQAYVPGLDQQPLFSEVFTPTRPRSLKDYDEAKSYVGSLFLLTAASGTFAIRGQIFQETFEGDEYLVLCGAPWLSWMMVNQPEVKLRLQDFSPQDVQLDQLFYMSTEARMVADLEQLNGELQQAKEAVDLAHLEKNELFARMSHEMRTPLNGVVSALSLMRDEQSDGKLALLLDLASKSSSNLMQVINYVLDVSKLESDESSPEEVAFDLHDFVVSVSDVVRARSMEKELELTSRCDAALPRRLIGDVNLLRQALLNLVINAIKFTDSGTVKIDVGLARSTGQTIRFEVQDSGLGIPKDKQAIIFDAFTTLSGVGEAGSGLGLNIARRNVESMGGRLGVTSTPGVGSMFWIELPLQFVDEDTSYCNPPVAVEETKKDHRFKGSVLLVDDNETNLMLGSMILEGMGLTVTQAISGEVAVQLAGESHFDLVFMDISMPGIDGYEATRRIREWRDADTLPIVALTAYASSLEQSESERSGMNGYLTKPIERERLAAALARWLTSVDEAGSVLAEKEVSEEEFVHVDLAVLKHLESEIGISNLEKVITKFSEEAVRRWAVLAAASDREVLARESHTLASTCRSFGLPGVADRLNLVEGYAKSDGAGDAPDLEMTGIELTSGLRELRTVIASLGLQTQ